MRGRVRTIIPDMMAPWKAGTSREGTFLAFGGNLDKWL